MTFSHNIPEARIGELFELSNGINFSANAKGRGTLTVDVLNMYGDGLEVGLGNLYRVDVPVKPDRLLAKGDILFVRSSVKRTGVGWPSVFGGSDEPIAFCGFLIRARARAATIDSRYVVRYLRQPWVRAQVIAESGTTAITNTSQERLARVKIPLPPLEEQRRIADILDKADAIRRKRKEAIALTEELLQSAFLEMFGDPVTNPKGWPVKRLEDVVARPFQNGAYFPRDRYVASEQHGIEMVHMSDAFYGNVSRGTMKRVDADERERELYALCSDDLLIARRSLNYEGSAKPCLVPQSDEPLLFESSLIRITPNQSIVRLLYLFAFLSNERARREYVLPNVTRSTISGINQAGLARVSIVVPDLAKQDCFERVWGAVARSRSRYDAVLRASDELFDSLVSRAFRGELIDGAKTQLALLHEQS